MVVKAEENNICTYSECGHTKCNRCTTVMMSVPLATDEIVFPTCGSGTIHLCERVLDFDDSDGERELVE
jgi:hypothetical protein